MRKSLLPSIIFIGGLFICFLGGDDFSFTNYYLVSGMLLIVFRYEIVKVFIKLVEKQR